MVLLTLIDNKDGSIIIDDYSLIKNEYDDKQISSFLDIAKELLILECIGYFDINYQNDTRKEQAEFMYIRPSIDQLVIKDNKLVGIYINNKYSLFPNINGVLLLDGNKIGTLKDNYQASDNKYDPSYYEDDDVIRYYLGRYPSKLDIPSKEVIDGLKYFNDPMGHLKSIPNLELITK